MKEETKKEYQKPEFTRVKLVPEEAVLGGCKTIGAASGPESNGSKPNCGLPDSGCLTDGT